VLPSHRGERLTLLNELPAFQQVVEGGLEVPGTEQVLRRGGLSGAAQKTPLAHEITVAF